MKKLLLVLLLSANAMAIPRLVNYQGQLTSPTGTPLDTTVAMTFNIWPTPTGGVSVWTETHPAVSVTNGLFNVQLGSITTLTDIFSVNRWLGITIQDDPEMTPREQLLSVAHAYRVGTVDGASGGTISGNVNIAGKANIGSGNVNSGSFAFVAGQNDTASGSFSTVSGGFGNSASGTDATVGGGSGNTASAISATASGGSGNSASGIASCIPGGANNICSGVGSFTCGNNAHSIGDSSFVFNDGRYGGNIGGQARRFIVIASDGSFIHTNSTATLGAQLPANATAWVAICDSTKKNRYGQINTSEVLSKLSQIPIETWSYKDDPNHVKHIGPMAQDFYAAFHVGESDTTISTLDPDGVALASIQELAKRNSALEAEVAELKQLVEQMIQLGHK